MSNTGIIDTCQPVNLHHPLTRGLVSRWKNIPNFRGGYTVRDLCRHNYANDGTWNDAPASKWVGSTRGGMGQWKFDGSNDHFEVADHNSLAIQKLTFAVWVYRLADGAYGHLIVKSSNPTWTSPYGRYVLRFEAGNNMACWVDGVGNVLFGSGTVTKNAWRHVAMTYDGADLKIYLDGKEDATKAVVTSITASTYSLLIGVRTGVGEALNGYLDDAILYNRALSAVEILQLMHISRQRFDPTLNWVTHLAASASTPVSPYYYQHLLAG